MGNDVNPFPSMKYISITNSRVPRKKCRSAPANDYPNAEKHAIYLQWKQETPDARNV